MQVKRTVELLQRWTQTTWIISIIWATCWTLIPTRYRNNLESTSNMSMKTKTKRSSAEFALVQRKKKTRIPSSHLVSARVPTGTFISSVCTNGLTWVLRLLTLHSSNKTLSTRRVHVRSASTSTQMSSKRMISFYQYITFRDHSTKTSSSTRF